MSKHHMVSTLNHWFFVDIENQLISEHLCPFIGVKASEIPKLLNPLPKRQLCQSGFTPREMYYFTMSQVYELFAKAPNRKFIEQLIKVFNQEVLPLFNQIKHDDFKKDIDMNIITTNQPLTMSSKEMAELTDTRHDSVLRTVKSLIEKEILLNTNCGEYQDSTGRKLPCYFSDKRDSLVIVARLSPEFTAKVVDRWQELETGTAPQLGYNSALKLLGVPEQIVPVIAKVYEEKQLLENKLQEAKPLIGFAETVQKAEKGILVRDLAYIAQNEQNIKIGEKRLWNWLRTMGFIHQRSTRPMQEYVERGYFIMQPTIVHHHSGAQEHITTKITGKGQIYFLNKLKEFFNTGESNACPSI